MNNIFGVRHEDKYAMERRVPLVPQHIRRLIQQNGLSMILQKSPKRIISEQEYADAGVVIADDLTAAPVIFGIKEIPDQQFEEGKTYMFFSHVIKGQKHNMPMLKTMIEKKVTLIDYEKVTDEKGRRLIFFGRYAGIAGMINSLWSLGQRLMLRGIETPLVKIQQAHKYNSLLHARREISAIGQQIIEKGLPADICPLIVGFTGYGNVSTGAQFIMGLLPVKEISPLEAMSLKNKKNLPCNVLYKVVFREEHMAARNDEEPFLLSHYYKYPEMYHNIFEKYIPHLSVLMNCMYWDDRFPRLVTKEALYHDFSQAKHHLEVIGDITCDPDGSIEITHKGTPIEDPVFVYNPLTRKYKNGFEGDGVLVMAVDILPSELPLESSMAFSQVLSEYVAPIVQADYSCSFEQLALPAAVKRAVILYNGQLTPEYRYLAAFLQPESQEVY